ncbi:MAG: hypothetical protein KH057_04355, partial [Bacteroides sp.]|nr:hypothetical protein [Bacteroides sp.]
LSFQYLIISYTFVKDKDIMDKMFNKDEEIGCLLEIFYSILQLHYRLLNKKRPPQFLEAAPIVKRIKLQIT